MAKPKTLSIDIESYSAADLPDVGVYRYAEDKTFGILLIAYSVNDGPVQVIDCLGNAGDDDEEGTLLNEFCNLLTDPTVEKYAFNANFERVTLGQFLALPMDPAHWHCTMVHALTLGLPGSLAAVGQALGLPEDEQKAKTGKALIDYFCKPCKPTKANGGRVRNLPQHDPDKWRLFIEYNRQDVVTEMAIRERLEELGKVPEHEHVLWALDQQINDRGIRIDRVMVNNIIDYDEAHTAELLEEAKMLSGLSNPNSLPQLKAWLGKYGISAGSLTKDSLEDLLQTDLPDAVRRVLEIRQATGKTSTAKYSKMAGAVCRDGRLRGTLQFYGASRSGRWSGKLVQVHNLARNAMPDLDLARELVCEDDFDTLETLFGEPSFVFSELVRTALIPSKDHLFVVSDFSAIEARVVAWVAGEQWVLDAFRAGKDIYCETASMMYHVPVVKHGENGELRQKGKIAVLACGYQGGVGAMKQMDKGGTIPEEELQSVVDQWRKANPMIVKLWKDVEKAAITAIEERRSVRRGIRVPADNLEAREAMAGGPVRPYSVREGVALVFTYKDGNLYITLPSGRSLCYFGARLKDGKYGPQIIYKGVNQTTKKWEDTETYGGKLVENIVQGIARDCLAEAMLRVDAMGYDIVMHVHDEMIVDVTLEQGPGSLRYINEAMGAPIDWAPGLPLKGDGYVCEFYRKD
jgi:DNA polymerase